MISYWDGPKDDASAQAAVDAGFNTVMCKLDLCRRHGLKALLPLGYFVLHVSMFAPYGFGFGFLLLFHHWSRKTTIADGKGAVALPPRNLTLPLMNRISPRNAYLCHHSVSVRAGTRQTTVAPRFDSRTAFRIHFAISHP